MLHKAKFYFPTKKVIYIQNPKKDNIGERLRNHIYKEESFFRHYLHILHSSFTKLNSQVEDKDNIIYDLIDTIICIADILDLKYDDDIYKSNSLDEIIKITNQYVQEHINLPDNYMDFISIKDDIIQYNKSFTHNEKYSFYRGTKIFLSANLCPQDAKTSIIRMLFARDIFNFEAIKLLREYLINSPMANATLQLEAINKKQTYNLLTIFRSDYKLIKKILYIYDESNNTNTRNLFSYEQKLVENGKLNIILFDYINSLIYSRYIIAVYIFLIESTYLHILEDKNIEFILIKIYRRLGLLILSFIFKDISFSELMWFQQLMTLDDILVHSYYITPDNRIAELESLLSTYAAHYTPKHTSKMPFIINDIVDSAIKLYKDGSEYSHIQMIEYFKKKKKYADYFNIRGFERNLKSQLK